MLHLKRLKKESFQTPKEAFEGMGGGGSRDLYKRAKRDYRLGKLAIYQLGAV